QTPRIRPRSTTLTGYSGSSTSCRASVSSWGVHVASAACIVIIPLPLDGGARVELLVATLELANQVLVGRSAPLPAYQHIVPADRSLLEQEALIRGIELRRERAVDDILAALGVVMRRDVQPQALAQRDRGGHPLLAQLVVGRALEAVGDLLFVFLQVIRQAKPL